MHHFRSQIKQPIIGVGHSMGGSQIATLSVIQRRLFSSIILLDPAIGPPDVGLDVLRFERMTLRRKTTWPNRQAAAKAVQKMFNDWDPEVLELFTKFAVVDETIPGPQFSSIAQPVSLATKQYHELVNYLKPVFIYDGEVRNPKIVYQTGTIDAFHMLGLVTCNTYFLCGSRDTPSESFIRDLWLRKTANLDYSRIPGEKRTVKVDLLPNTGHFLAMENPRSCSQALAVWIRSELKCWKQKEATRGNNLADLSLDTQETIADEWMRSLRSKL
ncbi:toxin biosynthesis [Colletotrichum tofieldiae]|nr:toxin biosynthesis [Colletotrichum tofieldiae]